MWWGDEGEWGGGGGGGGGGNDLHLHKKSPINLFFLISNPVTAEFLPQNEHWQPFTFIVNENTPLYFLKHHW